MNWDQEKMAYNLYNLRLMNWFVRIMAIPIIIMNSITFGEEVKLSQPQESESETIEKCLQDLKSDSIPVRKRAVLILGKYSNPIASKAIIRSLEDYDATIRRSALVSITEKPITPDAVEPVLKMIGDGDVHIRRIASSFIPEIMRGYRIPRHRFYDINNS